LQESAGVAHTVVNCEDDNFRHPPSRVRRIVINGEEVKGRCAQYVCERPEWEKREDVDELWCWRA
jgi:hypothetical protein